MTASRRSALVLMAAATAGLVPRPSIAGASATRRLSFEHLHTGERLTAVYRTAHGYDEAGLRDINHILRDWRTGEVTAIDPALLDDLFDVQAHLGHRGTIGVISGYRSPETNDTLADKGRGVSRRSLHMEGRAIDITLSGVPTLVLRDAALALGRGGVGTYVSPGFVHLDTGRVRRWGD